MAISVDAVLLERVERLRASTRESRSAIVGRALALLTGEAARRAEVERYVAAYREAPESVQEVEAARRLARRQLRKLPWNEP